MAKKNLPNGSDSTEQAAAAAPGDGPATGLPGGSDLETLRDILFGPQTRATDTRLGQLERQLVTTQRDLSATLEEQVGALRASSSRDLATARGALEKQLEKQKGDSAAALQAAQDEQREALAQATAAFDQRLQETRTGLQEKIDGLGNRLMERLLELQEEYRQRDDDLRQQLLALSAWLDDRKTSRDDLARLLITMGEEIRDLKKAPATGEEHG